MDNTAAVACVNKMGTSHSYTYNMIVNEIWEFCIERQIWISAAYVPRELNVQADLESRKINLDCEWKLRPDLLHMALWKLECKPNIDVFASRLNA